MDLTICPAEARIEDPNRDTERRWRPTLSGRLTQKNSSGTDRNLNEILSRMAGSTYGNDDPVGLSHMIDPNFHIGNSPLNFDRKKFFMVYRT